MENFSLYLPVRPYKLNQEWGRYDPVTYSKFHFTRHNGVDLGLVNGQPIYAPIEATVVKVGYEPTGAGFYNVMRTPKEYLFKDGLSAYAELSFFHLVKQPDIATWAVGEVCALGDNTGFSTGNHTHFRLRRLKLVQSYYTQLDLNEAQNSIDPVPYFNGVYADSVTPTFHHTFTQDLRFGEIDPEVRFLQKALQLSGEFPATQEITPFYGEITRKAVLEFQYRYKVASVGELWMLNGKTVGVKTRQRLNILFNS